MPDTTQPKIARYAQEATFVPNPKGPWVLWKDVEPLLSPAPCRQCHGTGIVIVAPRTAQSHPENCGSCWGSGHASSPDPIRQAADLDALAEKIVDCLFAMSDGAKATRIQLMQFNPAAGVERNLGGYARIPALLAVSATLRAALGEKEEQ